MFLSLTACGLIYATAHCISSPADSRKEDESLSKIVGAIHKQGDSRDTQPKTGAEQKKFAEAAKLLTAEVVDESSGDSQAQTQNSKVAAQRPAEASQPINAEAPVARHDADPSGLSSSSSSSALDSTTAPLLDSSEDDTAELGGVSADEAAGVAPATGAGGADDVPAGMGLLEASSEDQTASDSSEEEASAEA
jgi:hypothetical protein